MTSPTAAAPGDGSTATSAPVPPRVRVEVFPIPEAEARSDAEYFVQTIKEMDLNEEETITLVQLTLMKASGAIGLWDYEGKMRDLFLTANRRKNGYQPLW